MDIPPLSLLERLRRYAEDAVGQVGEDGSLADQEIDLDRHAGKDIVPSLAVGQFSHAGLDRDAIAERAVLLVRRRIGGDLLHRTVECAVPKKVEGLDLDLGCLADLQMADALLSTFALITRPEPVGTSFISGSLEPTDCPAPAITSSCTTPSTGARRRRLFSMVF